MPRVPLNLFIPEAFDECLSYEEQILFIWNYIQTGTVSPEVTITPVQGVGTKVTITDKNHPEGQEFIVRDGVSPKVILEQITNGTRVTIKDAQYPEGQTFDVMNGESGATGASGQDGYSPAVTISSVTGGHQVKITDKSHPSGQTFNVMDGVDGESGATGASGSDGFSPIITVEDITDGHRITITDASGTTTVDVMNGETGPAASYPNIDASASVDGNVGTPSVTVTRTGDTGDWNYDFAFHNLKGASGQSGATGATGASGSDGFSPTLQVADITGGHRITITDVGGTTTVDVMDGVDGQSGATGASGQDGYSPAVTISSVTGGHQVKITDKSHPSGQTFNVMDGVDGQSGATGATGASGQDGYSPAVTISSVTGGHRVKITDKTHPSGQTFDVMDGVKGDTGASGSDGVTPNISATASVNGTVGTPSVTVTKSGTTANPSFAFAFSNIKGATGASGQSGATGQSGKDGNCIWTATADPKTPNYTFAISALSGPTGYTPQVGDIVVRSVYRYTITSVGSTTVLTGTRTSIRGAKGDTGSSGSDGFSPTVVPSGITGGHRLTITDVGGTTTVDIMDGATGATGIGVPAGGTTGQVLAKSSDTDYATEWVDAGGGGGGLPTQVSGNTSMLMNIKYWDEHGDTQYLPAWRPLDNYASAGKVIGCKGTTYDGDIEYPIMQWTDIVNDIKVSSSSIDTYTLVKTIFGQTGSNTTNVDGESGIGLPFNIYFHNDTNDKPRRLVNGVPMLPIYIYPFVPSSNPNVSVGLHTFSLKTVSMTTSSNLYYMRTMYEGFQKEVDSMDNGSTKKMTLFFTPISAPVYFSSESKCLWHFNFVISFVAQVKKDSEGTISWDDKGHWEVNGTYTCEVGSYGHSPSDVLGYEGRNTEHHAIYGEKFYVQTSYNY